MAAIGVDEALLAVLAEEIRLDGGITEVSSLSVPFSLSRCLFV